MKAVILAGGSGTRLWPLSRRSYPKQFLKINGAPSLLQETVRRLLPVVSPADMVVLTNAQYKFHVRADLRECSSEAGPHVVLEPCSRNTAPALALAAVFCRDQLRARGEEVIFVAPADHVIKPADRFAHFVRRAEEIAAEGRIVTFGVAPRSAETAYGYIHAGDHVGADYHHVEAFTEKPDRETAQAYVASGRHYWNSGMFAFRIDVLLDELRRHAPAIYAIVEDGYDRALAQFASMPTISIDYAVMERTSRLVMLPVDLYWNDVGSWDAIFELMGRDADGNLKVGDVIALDTQDTLIMADKRLITTIGLTDLLVIETGDAILIARRGDAQKVKQVVERLQQDRRSEADEHLTTYRPWGHYTVLERRERYQIKRVVVNPGEKLSLQLHRHRSEHWVVVRGTALVTLGESEQLVRENEGVYVPRATRHRVANPGSSPLEIIEVQNGDYIGEDDIVRFDDVYGRHENPR
jgi:mannose-1-phosphate guanylyltransferase/mannose-6-phosphate isomerase